MPWLTKQINWITLIARGNELLWVTTIHSNSFLMLHCSVWDVTDTRHHNTSSFFLRVEPGKMKSFTTVLINAMIGKTWIYLLLLLNLKDIFIFKMTLWMWVLCSWSSFLFEFIVRMKKSSLFSTLLIRLRRQALDIERRLQEN